MTYSNRSPIQLTHNSKITFSNSINFRLKYLLSQQEFEILLDRLNFKILLLSSSIKKKTKQNKANQNKNQH